MTTPENCKEAPLEQAGSPASNLSPIKVTAQWVSPAPLNNGTCQVPESWIPPKNCTQCHGQGWYWRTPDGFNPFLAGGFNTARSMYKVTCPCDVRPVGPFPAVDREA